MKISNGSYPTAVDLLLAMPHTCPNVKELKLFNLPIQLSMIQLFLQTVASELNETWVELKQLLI